MQQLTQEQMMAALQSVGGYMTPDGRMIIPQQMAVGGSAGNGGEGGGAEMQTMGFGSYDPNRMGVGDSYGVYGKDGSYAGENTFKEESNNLDMLLAGLAAAGGMHFLLPGAAGVGELAGAAGGGSAAGDAAVAHLTSGGGLGGGVASQAGAAGGFGGLGFGGTTGLPTFGGLTGEFGGLTAAPFGSGFAGATFSDLAAGLGGLGTAGAGAAGAAGGAGGAGAAASALGGAGSGLGGLAGLAGPAAAVAGGLLGAQSNDQSQTQERKMDPRMDKFIYDDLFPRTQGLLSQQMPQAQQTGDQMRQIGMGLLGSPVAGNGFSMFYKGR